MKLEAQTQKIVVGVVLTMSAGEARDLLHDLTKDTRQNKSKTSNLVKALKMILPTMEPPSPNDVRR